MSLQRITLSLALAIALGVSGCANATRFMTGLPPEVSVSQEGKFNPALSKQIAAMVLVPRGNNLTDPQTMTRQLTDIAEGELIRLGYSIVAGGTVQKVLAASQAWNGDPDQFDPLPIAREAGADLVLLVTISQLSESTEYDSTGRTSQRIAFSATAKAMGAASGRVGWVATASGEARPREGGTKYVANEVVKALVAQLPSKVAKAP